MKSDEEKYLAEEKNIFKELLGWLVYILIIFGLTYLVITFVGQRTRVTGSSMETTLSDGDNLIVDKISYRFRDPERYDIIVFPYQYQENTYYIKRMNGMPGETIQIIDGEVNIDGQILGEEYGTEVMQDAGIAEVPVTLGEDEYYIADLIGMEVYLEDGSHFGTLKDVMETGANDVYIIKTEEGKEVLIPAIYECILDVDVEAGKMEIHLLDGLV